MKNAILKDHFLHPRRMGEVDEPTGRALVKSDTCSDLVRMTVRIDGGGIVTDIKTRVYGCGYAIAGASYFNEFAHGKRASEVAGTTIDALVESLGEVPPGSRGCVALAPAAFKKIFRAVDGGA
ncbi:MAG TPA: iron-sulfur cluster assembly scaffold protein [Spirochaetota bacterium]|nr:iron-sulfur cluster assembly scaffold protein [Spirochaetota bacterium]